MSEEREKIILPDRKIYLDYLRVFAIFAMIMLHVASQNWAYINVNSFTWQIFNFFDGILRWCVPIFVMISGNLFLSKEILIKKLYFKYILRLIIAFLFWSCFYALVDIKEKNFISVYSEFITGHYHMWFILMIIGLYICVPFIKLVANNKNISRYYLLITFLFAFFLPQVVTLVNDFGANYMIKAVSKINCNMSFMYMNNVVAGFVPYFILGNYLDKTELNKKTRMIIYIMGVLGFFLTVYLSWIVSVKAQIALENYYGPWRVNVLFESVAVYIWFKYKKYNVKKLNAVVVKLSKYSFGAYLVHAFVIEKLDIFFSLNSLSFNPIFSVVLIGVLVFIVSFMISGILNNIPSLKKYIV